MRVRRMCLSVRVQKVRRGPYAIARACIKCTAYALRVCSMRAAYLHRVRIGYIPARHGYVRGPERAAVCAKACACAYTRADTNTSGRTIRAACQPHVRHAHAALPAPCTHPAHPMHHERHMRDLRDAFTQPVYGHEHGAHTQHALNARATRIQHALNARATRIHHALNARSTRIQHALNARSTRIHHARPMRHATWHIRNTCTQHATCALHATCDMRH
jgi:hypothetical protein